MNKYLVVIVGPTAVGKTALTVELAKHFNTEIISADSRQCYKELSVGTAKPSPEEQQGIKHYFIDSHSVTEDLNVADFEKLALDYLDNIFESKSIAILTGGTGLYINAVCNGLDPLPSADQQTRDQLQQILNEKGIEGLQELLKKLDPKYYETIDLKNPQRVIRALEVCLTTGKPFSVLRSGEKKERDFKIIKIGLNRSREELYERINQRVDQMIDSGLLEEAKSVFEYRKYNALNTVGYKEMFNFIEGKANWEETVNLIKQNTRRYAKRQLTWFRKDQEIEWFHPDNKEEIVAYIERHAKVI